MLQVTAVPFPACPAATGDAEFEGDTGGGV